MKVGTLGCGSTTEPPYLDSFQVKNGMLWIGIARESNINPPQQASTESFFLKLPHFWGGWFLGPLVGSFPHILTAKSRYSHPSPVRQAERRRLRQTSDVSTAHSKVFVLRTNCICLFLLIFFSMMFRMARICQKKKERSSIFGCFWFTVLL